MPKKNCRTLTNKKHNNLKPSGEVPTPFAFIKSDYDLVKLRLKESTVFVNKSSTPYERAFRAKKISEKQKDSCLLYERRYCAYWGRSGGRNLLDTTPRGSNAVSDQLLALQLKENLEELEAILSGYENRILRETCVYYEPLGDRRMNRKRFKVFFDASQKIADFYF